MITWFFGRGPSQVLARAKSRITRVLKSVGNSNTRKSIWWIWLTVGIVGVLLIAAAFGAVAIWATPSNQGIKDAASALALITATAVGIERVLEVFWNFVDTTGNSFWPLTAIDKTINNVVNAITDATAGPIARLKVIADDAKDKLNWTDAQVAAFPGEINDLNGQLDQLKQLAPGSKNAQAIAAYAKGILSDLSGRYPGIKADVDAAAESVNAITELVNSLSDNPGRRILSLYLGALIGLGVASALGLDAFNATLGMVSQSVKWGVAFTGLVIGLGSSPTHELIKVLQMFKQNLKSA